MRVNKITKGYRNYNEDTYIIHNNYYIVIDGATPLYDNQASSDTSIAYELVKYAEVELPKLLDQYSFEDAINNLSINAYKYFKFTSNEPAKLPSMGIAAVYIEDKYSTLYLLGDCAISYLNKKGKDYRFVDTSLEELDKISINEFFKTKKREDIKETLIKHRNLLGIKYQAFIPSNNPNFKFMTRRVKTISLQKVLIYSDGYYALRKPFRQVNNHKEFVNTDLNTALKSIQNSAYNDQSINKHKRLKVIDDITAIEIIFDK